MLTPVPDQRDCNAAYAFAALGSLESVQALALGSLVPLSAQQLVDCQANRSLACRNSVIERSYQYIIQNKGIQRADSYPYTGDAQQPCRFDRAAVGARMIGMIALYMGDEEGLRAAVAKRPVAVRLFSSRYAKVARCSPV